MTRTGREETERKEKGISLFSFHLSQGGRRKSVKVETHKKRREREREENE